MYVGYLKALLSCIHTCIKKQHTPLYVANHNYDQRRRWGIYEQHRFFFLPLQQQCCTDTNFNNTFKSQTFIKSSRICFPRNHSSNEQGRGLYILCNIVVGSKLRPNGQIARETRDKLVSMHAKRSERKPKQRKKTLQRQGHTDQIRNDRTKIKSEIPASQREIKSRDCQENVSYLQDCIEQPEIWIPSTLEPSQKQDTTHLICKEIF